MDQLYFLSHTIRERFLIATRTKCMALLTMFLIAAAGFSQTSGPNNPGSSGTIIGGTNWTDPFRILTLNSDGASVALFSGGNSRNLTATNYNMAVPATATITGIGVMVRRGSNSNQTANIEDLSVQLIKAGAVQGNNLASNANDWENIWENITYGGPGNLWGSTWTPAEVNANNFGVAFRVTSNATRTAYVDVIQVTVYYTMPPTITSFSPSSYCAGSTPLVTINGSNFTGATAVAFNGVPSASFNVISATQITATPASGLSSNTVSVTTPSGTATGSFTLNPLPAVNPITGSNSVCIGANTALSNTTGGGTWSSLNTAIATVNASGLVTGIASGNTPIRYTVTNGNGCTNSVIFSMTVNPLPVLGGPNSVCVGGNITATANSGGTWSSDTPALASVDASGIVTGLAPGNAVIRFTNGSGCIQLKSVSVHAITDVITDPSSVSICSGASVSFSVSATGNALTYQWYEGATALSNGGGISGANATTLTVSNASAGGNYFCIVSGSCGTDTSATATLTITQAIAITAQPVATQTICEGGTAVFSLVNTGASSGYQWLDGSTVLTDGPNISGSSTSTLTLTNVTAAQASANYHCVITAIAPCTDVISNYAVLVVNSLPAITTDPAASQTVCAGSAVSFSVAATGGNLSYQWYNGVTPITDNGIFSGSSTSVLTINPAMVVDTSSYHVVVTNGCGTATSAMGALTVDPTAFIGLQTTSVCSGSAFDFSPVSGTPTAATIVPSGTLYTWTAPSVTGGITGGTAENIPQTSIINTLQNPTIAPQVATYTVTPITGGCPGTPFTFQVTVNPAVDIPGNPPSQTACSGSAFSFTPTNGGGNVVPIGTTYSWGIPVISPAGSVSGATAGVSQLSVNQTLSNTSSVDGTATYTVTAASGTCNESTFTVIFTVRPVPTVAGTPTAQTICSNTAITTISMSNPNAVFGPISYSWTRDHLADVSGTIGASGFGQNISGTLINNTGSPVTVTFSLTATSQYSCPSAVETVTVVVNPVPTASALPTAQSICSGDAITTIALTNPNGVTGTQFNWTRTNIANTTGIAASGSGNISGTLTNNSVSAQTTVFTITPTAAGCPGTPITISVTVNPRPSVAVTAAQTSVCSGTAITPLTITNPNGIGATVLSWSWTSPSGSVTGPPGGTGSTVSGIWNNTSTTVQTVTITATATLGSCSSSASTSFLVYPNPTIVASLTTQAICSAATSTAVTLSSNISGTTFSWTRVPNASITTAGASSGTGTIPAMTFTNTSTVTQTVTFNVTATPPGPNTCTNTSTVTITVYAPLAPPVIGNSQNACVFSTPNALTMSQLPTGGSGGYTYQWQRSTAPNGTYNNIAGATGPTYTPPTVGFFDNPWYYRLRVIAPNPCGGTVYSNVVAIEPVNNGSINTNVTNEPTAAICGNANFTVNWTSEHLWFTSVRMVWSTNNPALNPASTAPTGGDTGTYGFLGIGRDSFGSMTFAGSNTTNASIVVTVTGTPQVYDYPYNTSQTVDCTLENVTFNVTLLPRPVASVVTPTASTTTCNGTSGNITLHSSITDAATTFNWTRNNTSSVSGTTSGSGTTAAGVDYLIPTVLTNNTATVQSVTYTITPISNGCSGTAITFTILVAPPSTPGVIAANQNICVGGDPAAFTVTTAATGSGLTYQWHSSTTGVAGSYAPIASATNATYDAPAGLSVTTYFIRETISTVNSTACSSFSNAVVVTVNQINAGAVNGDQTICSGQTPAPFTIGTAASGTAPITYLWQFNTTGCASATWTNATGVNNAATYAPPALTQTTYFRRLTIPNGQTACQDNSICITVTVNDVTPGTIGNDQALCTGQLPATITELTAATGSNLNYQWQSSTVGCGNSASFTNIPGAQNSDYTPGPIAVTTYFRRIVTATLNGVTCTSAVSNCVTISINAVTAGAIGPNRTICQGGNAGAIGFTTAATGSNLSYQWQSSTNAAGPYTNIGFSGTSYTPTGLTQTTYYQVIVTATSGATTCSQTTNLATVSVNSISAPTISGAQSLCAGEDPSALVMSTASTAAGSISYQWQSSPTGSAPWTNVGAGSSYDPPVLAQTLYYQVIATSTLNSLNCTAVSNMIAVTSNGKTWNGSAGTDWNNPSNWTPNGVPTAAHCVVIANVANDPVISGVNFVAYALNLTVQNGGNLQVASNNSIQVTNFVNVNPGGIFFVADDASLVQIDNVANVGTVSIQRITPPVYRYDYTYWNSPVTLASNYTLGNLSALTQPDKFYSWNPTVAGGNGNWIQESVATVMNPAKGYIVRAPNTHSTNPSVTMPYTATFTGTPNNGNFQSPILKGTLAPGVVYDKLNLIGNPYPSAIDADLFLNDPANAAILDGTMYFWTHHSPPSAAYPNPFYGNFSSNYTASDYATYTSAMGGTSTVPSGYGGVAPNGYVATGQSFFIKATAAGNAVFNNSMRVTGMNNVFFRQAHSAGKSANAIERHRIWLNLANEQGAFSQILVGYAEGATDGKDRGYDGDTFASNAVTFYSRLEDSRLTVQGRTLPFQNSDMVPLGYKATIAATFTIGIDHLDGLFENQQVYLEDKALNVIHDLKSSAYVFTSATGTFNDRFVLRYTSEQLQAGDHHLSTLTAFISNRTLFVQSPERIESIAIFDISGKHVVTFEPDNTLFEKSFPYAQGIYIAKVTLSDGSSADVKLAN